MITLDGSHGEGGGQILRYALAFSVLTQKPFSIVNIRKSRPKPGLAKQHVSCVEAFLAWKGAKAIGCDVGSTELEYYPTNEAPGRISIDIGTAGSATLILQALLPALLAVKKPLRIKIIGGTDVPWSIPFDSFKHGALFFYQKYLNPTELVLERRGYYPEGDGSIVLRYDGDTGLVKKHSPLVIVPPLLVRSVQGILHANASLMNETVLERMRRAAGSVFALEKVPIKITAEYSKTKSPGGGCTFWCLLAKEDAIDATSILLADQLLADPRHAEVCGETAAKKLCSLISAKHVIDPLTADCLIPLLALFGGRILVPEITNHMRSGVYVAQAFGYKITILESEKIIQAQQA